MIERVDSEGEKIRDERASRVVFSMSSRFFARGGSDSEDDDEDEDETTDSGSDSGSGSESGSGSGSDSDDDGSSDDSSSDDDDDDEKRGSRFLAGADSDDDDDDDRRVVLSARDKRLSELSGVCEEIRNKIKINDWIASATLFDKMNKLWEKMAKMAALRGGKIIKVPKVYLRTLVELEASLTTTLSNKELRKKMSTTNSKSLNAMKQRLKKHNKDFEAEIEAFKEKRARISAAAGSGGGGTSEYGADGADGDFRGGDFDEEFDDDEDEDDDDEDELIEGELDDGDGSGVTKEDIFTMDPEEVTEEMVEEKLKEIAMERGKKGTNRRKTVEQLVALSGLAKSTEQKLHVLLLIISSLFDLNPSLSSTMSNVTWQKTVMYLLEILQILEENPLLVFSEDLDVGPPTYKPDQDVKKLAGNLFAFVERIDDELFKTFQVMDPHTHEYVLRLQDELKFLLLADKMAEYFYRFGIKHNLAKLCLRRLEHLYYKHSKVYDAMRRGLERAKSMTSSANGTDTAEAAVTEVNDIVNGEEGLIDEGEGVAEVEALVPFVFPEAYVLPEDMALSLKSICKVIYRFGDERTKARAMLCEIYHKAIHDDFFGARDLMLMSHLQDVIQNMDILTQILFNRSMAQLGLAAFRSGLITESHACIGELHIGGSLKVKELLAQGVSNSRYHDKTAEQEKLERRRQMPFHMHINLELLEAVHLTTAMLLEVPSMALHAHEPNRRIISRNFVRLLDHYERLTFTGPPENVRDHVMSAAQLLSNGQWAESYGMIEKLTAWKLFEQSDEILAMIRRKIQEEALKAYVFTSAKCYASLSLKQLCDIFGMESKHAQSVICKLIMSEEIHGSFDQTTGTLLMHAIKPTLLQSRTIQYCDKMSLLFETNERALELRGGGRLSSRDDDDSGAKEGGSTRDKRFGSDRYDDGYRGGRFRNNDRDSMSRGRDSMNRFGGMHKQYNNFGRKEGRPGGMMSGDSYGGGGGGGAEYTSGADMIRRGGEKRGGMGSGMNFDRRSNDRMVSLSGSWRERR